VANAEPAATPVDIWRIDLSAPEDATHYGRRLLSPDETRRADRFHFERDRRRFTMARAAMRQILCKYANVAPQELVFSYGANGKPELAGELKTAGLRFNLSHSSEVAVLAVAQGLTVGIDIEHINKEFATEEIAERFFSESEVKTLRSLPPTERTEAFFACWTRKEAYIKALGEGLSVPLDSFAVALRPGEPAALLHVRVDPAEVSRWSLYDIEVAKEYKSALAIEGRSHQLRGVEWEPQPAA
jgi:4'-phosphopantetheinyl transferase